MTTELRARRLAHGEASASVGRCPPGSWGCCREEQGDEREHREDGERGAEGVEAGSAFSSTTAVAVAGGTPASSSACSRSASEMNGTPLVSSVWLST